MMLIIIECILWGLFLIISILSIGNLISGIVNVFLNSKNQYEYTIYNFIPMGFLLSASLFIHYIRGM